MRQKFGYSGKRPHGSWRVVRLADLLNRADVLGFISWTESRYDEG